jgi:hypothetical protein
MSSMIEAAAPFHSKHKQGDAGWARYCFGCAMGLTAFCGMLWLAS